jgi:hypothetical protein
MLPFRRIVLATSIVALLAALHTQSAFAAFGFGIDTVIGATPLASPPPPSVLPGATEDGSPIIFPEVIGGTIIRTSVPNDGMDVDHDGSDVVAAPIIGGPNGNVVNPLLVATFIPTGTNFNSYLFHFDPVGSTPSTFGFYVSTITFDNPIVGIQLLSDGFTLVKPFPVPYVGTFEQGDTQVDLNGGSGPAYYPGGVSFRGLEEDSFVLTVSGNTVMMAGIAVNAQIDQVRIITASPIAAEVPEPTAFVTWALVSGVACIGAFKRRR